MTTVYTDYMDCCGKLTAKITNAKDIVAKLRREENDPSPGNPRPNILLNELRHIYQVGSEDLQRLRQLSREVMGDLTLIQRAAATFKSINTEIRHFATKFDGSG